MKGTVTITVPVLGLGCGGAGATTVERILRNVEGVVDVFVNPAVEAAYVTMDRRRASVERVLSALESNGYRYGKPIMLT